MTRFILALPLLAACAPVDCVVSRVSDDPKVQAVIWEPCPARAVPPAIDDKDSRAFTLPVASIPEPPQEIAPEPETTPEPVKPETVKPAPEPVKPEPPKEHKPQETKK